MQKPFGFVEAGGPTNASHCPFFAILPSRSDASRIVRHAQDLCRRAGLGGALRSADRLHISLHGLGLHRALPGHLVHAAREAGESVSFPEFDITFDCVGSFRSGRDGRFPFVLRSLDDIDALSLFHRALAAAMTLVGLGRWISLQFTPHITLLYDTRFARPREIEGIRFRVREFALIDSLIGQSRHATMARWPLKG
ncbi:2'-5' RNA ligase family protein [Bradyrhizobium sp. LHD-71]|uniref:2'-5' RNA ligase family protein n=1 Tax=Bradyrhizobium sp. LHD-71 TaxID=3072141 RepID=UPI00280C4841|nr:2'-5' RNA ligase family protein [Bradyrhizobium sp. LHD-71]MDQ8731139.1 2'-5' RNA ligase family protein [Bradyrhizobium sp. LHD-71]